ncbi:MAG TPA: hypothetical protein VK831_04970 [Candidatus Deferrimicrobiaceae bacterium]|nr:hypothetical protein [Candidatus Deferrimicrobiaceae bacterium]
MNPRRALIIRRRRPLGEPRAANAGATRMLEVLAEAGVDLLGPDTERTTWLLPQTVAGADLESGPDELFDVVLLGSHLVNTPDAALRTVLLGAAARHGRLDGHVLVEHHPLDWLETAAESWSERDGERLGMVDVRVDPPFVSAVSVFEVGGEVVRQPFTARVLTDDELRGALELAGLTVTRRLSPTWLEAVHAAESLS